MKVVLSNQTNRTESKTWTTSLQRCIALVILFHAVGLATFAALVVIILTVLCNTPPAKLQHRFQSNLMAAQDERVKASSEALINMKVLKLYAWEIRFKRVTENLRAEEYKCNVFTFVDTLCLVQHPIRAIPDVIGTVIPTKVAFARVVKFFEAPELQSANVRQNRLSKNTDPAISITSGWFSWEENSSKPTLRNITIELKMGKKWPYVGKLALVNQPCWLQFLEKSPISKDLQRYEETIERCSLVKDLESLPFDDLTEIGERGDAVIYLLDDPFSAVDAHTARSLFNEYVMEALSGKAVLLVTHQVDFFPAFDSVLLISDGEILQAAPYHHLLASSKEFEDLVNAHNETAGSGRVAEDKSSESHGRSTGEIKKSYVENQFKASKGDQLMKQEEREKGDTGFKPYMQYLNQNKGFLFFSISAFTHLLFVGSQILQNSWMAANVDNANVSELELIGIYLVIGFLSTLLLLFRSLFAVTKFSFSCTYIILRLHSSGKDTKSGKHLLNLGRLSLCDIFAAIPFC
ncbi:hypothetical protein PTKIN_Ptkin04bG0143200 [Pterospermum kingtungense]